MTDRNYLLLVVKTPRSFTSCTKQKDADQFYTFRLQFTPASSSGVLMPLAEDTLSDTEHECLETLQNLAAQAERTPSGHGVKSGEWSAECPVSRTRYHEIRKRLLDHDYVSNSAGLYQLTAKGEQVLSACPPGSAPMSGHRHNVRPCPPPLGGTDTVDRTADKTTPPTCSRKTTRWPRESVHPLRDTP